MVEEVASLIDMPTLNQLEEDRQVVQDAIELFVDNMKPDKKQKKKKDPDEIKNSLLTKRKKETPIHARELLSSGCTLLNLQCTGKATGCYPKGTYTHLVGDSDSGKTWLALTAFGEASINPSFDGYEFYYFHGENGALMDRAGCFGRKASDRIEDIQVSSPEDFYYGLDTRHNRGKPYIVVLDSMDSLMSLDDSERFDENKKLYEDGKEAKGSFGVAKPKTNSALLKVATNRLSKNGSIMIIISQTRDNIGFGAQFNPKCYSGGHAMKFYAQLQIWVSSMGDIKRTVKGKERQLGIYSKLHVKKNHITGAKGAVDIPIYHNPGMMDDIGSCIEYLTEEKVWSEAKGKVVAPEFDFEGTIEKLAQKIDVEGTEKEIRMLVSETWDEIQNACRVQRKSKYD